MLKKEDVNYYETNVNTEGTPSIELTNDIFFPIFKLGYLTEGNSEMFYFIQANLWKGEKINEEWNWGVKSLELEKCKLENLSPKYRESFRDIQKIENYYCINNINDLIGGNDYSNNFAYIEINFYPCYNYNDILKCPPSNILEQIFKNNYIEILFPDVELSPQIYKTPVKFGKRGTSFGVTENLRNDLYLYFHKLNIETDEDNFCLSENIKKESYLAFDSYRIVSSLNNKSPLVVLGIPYAKIYIELSDKIVTVKRRYTKLIDVLGNIGGIMGVIYSFFQIIISFLTDILYDISLVNNLFVIDIDKNNLVFKKVKKNINDINENIEQKEKAKEFNLKKELVDKSSERKINLNINKKTKIKRIHKSKPIKVYFETCDNSNSKKNIKDENKIVDNNSDMNKIDDLNRFKIDKENETENINNKGNKDNIKELNLTFFGDYFCFCHFRKNKNNKKNILNEAKKIIYEKNDIRNLFRILYSYGIEKEKKDK